MCYGGVLLHSVQRDTLPPSLSFFRPSWWEGSNLAGPRLCLSDLPPPCFSLLMASCFDAWSCLVSSVSVISYGPPSLAARYLLYRGALCGVVWWLTAHSSWFSLLLLFFGGGGGEGPRPSLASPKLPFSLVSVSLFPAHQHRRRVFLSFFLFYCFAFDVLFDCFLFGFPLDLFAIVVVLFPSRCRWRCNRML